MISWEQYLTIFLKIIREMYETELSRDRLRLEALEKINPFTRRFTFLKPCQIKVFELLSLSRILWIVSFESDKADADFEIVKGIKEHSIDFLEANEKYKDYRNAFEWAGLAKKSFPYISEETPSKFMDEHYMAMLFFSNPREKISPRDLALRIFNDGWALVLRAIQKSRIEKSASEILKEAKEISEVKASPSVLRAMKSIQGSLKRLKKIDEHEQRLISMGDELAGVRKLIGTSKEFLEWKAFTSDFEHLKKTHITREAFEAHIKRLDEKIEKGLEALNTRIEDVKAIKFWSKRTLLEIALFIWGAIITLYAAGILKF